MSSTSPDVFGVSVKLSEHNYQSWVLKMKAMLMSKKLWMYVTGALPKPEDASLLPEYLSNCYAAAGLILLALEDSQHTHVAGMEDDPKKMWDTLIKVRAGSEEWGEWERLRVTRGDWEGSQSMVKCIVQTVYSPGKAHSQW